MLVSQAQADFSGGFVREVAPELIGPTGAYDLVGCLIEESGQAFKRGGSAFLSGSAFGAAGLLGVWDVSLVAGPRTVFLAGSTGPKKLGVLDSDDSTVLQLSGYLAAEAYLDAPQRGTVLAGRLFVPQSALASGSRYGLMYAGSRKTARYSTGTVSCTEGSAVITGAGTAWLANVDVGMILSGVGPGGLVVRSVDSDTQLTVDIAADATAAGAAYELAAWIYTAVNTTPLLVPGVFGSAVGRLLVGIGNRLHFTASYLAQGAGAGSVGATDYHDFPARIVAVEGLRDAALVFTTEGVYALTGLANDQLDDFGNVQHRVERLDESLVCAGSSGVAGWQDQLVVPARNGIWLTGTVGRPVDIARSIRPYWLDDLVVNRTPGQACVYEQHYILPMVDSANEVQDVLVCRLDRPYGYRGEMWWPWTRLGTTPAQGSGYVAAFAARGRPGSPSKLLGASRLASSRVWDVKWFDPSASSTTDADGSTFTATVESRAFRLGRQPNLKGVLKRVRLQHKLVSASTTANVELTITDPEAGTAVLAAQAPEEAGGDTFSWQVTQVRDLYVRLKFVLAEAADSWTVKVVEVLHRPEGRV